MTEGEHHYRVVLDMARSKYQNGDFAGAMFSLGEAAGLAWVFYCQAPGGDDHPVRRRWNRLYHWAGLLETVVAEEVVHADS